jgi:hypothetical protein
MQLKDPELFQTESFVDGKWVGAKSGKRFEVIGMFYTPTSNSLLIIDTNTDTMQTPAPTNPSPPAPTTPSRTSTPPSKAPTRPSRPTRKSAPAPVPSSSSNGTPSSAKRATTWLRFSPMRPASPSPRLTGSWTTARGLRGGSRARPSGSKAPL